MSALGEAAEKYRAMGMHPFPLAPQTKNRPMIKWGSLEQTAPTADQVREWWRIEPNANIALAMGRGSLVVDLDGEGAEQLLTARNITLPDAPRVRTGGGFHVYVSVSQVLPNATALLSTNGEKPAIDIRCDGGYVVAPPSIHENGRRYMWVTSLALPLPPCPPVLVDLLLKRQAAPQEGAVKKPGDPGWFGEAWAGVPEGQRDATCARLAGLFLGHGMEPIHVFLMLVEWGRRCTPVFAERDVRKTVASITKREVARGKVHQPFEETPLPTQENEQQSRPMRVAVQKYIADAQNPRRVMVRTPFSRLNEYLIGGFRPAQLTYIAARPSIGKSALAIEFARGAAYDKKRVLFVSLESKDTQVALRTIAQDGKHSATELATFSVGPAVQPTIERVSDMTINVFSMPTIAAIVGEMDRLASTGFIVEFLVIDYLQLMVPPTAIRDRRLQIDWLSARLKQIAVEREIPVLCLSSVTRPQAEHRDKPPTLASLRESGQLEHDADVVLILHRKDGNVETQCFVAKNRDGKQGVVELLFRPEHVSFDEVAHEEERRADWR